MDTMIKPNKNLQISKVDLDTTITEDNRNLPQKYPPKGELNEISRQ